MKPTPLQIFCGYYLGLDLEWRYRFFNRHSLAAHFGIDPKTLDDCMSEYRMTPEDTRHVNFNLARAHATAQGLSEDGKHEELVAFAGKTYEQFQQALETYDPDQVFENVDYDNIFAEKKEG